MEKENSKSFKILIFLLIIAIIAIIIMGYYIYTLKGNNKNDTSKLETINPTNQEIVINDELINNAKKTYEEFLKLSIYQNSDIGPMPYLINELGLDTRENIDKIIEAQPLPNGYIQTNTKYDDFKNAMLKYMSSELFENSYSQYKNMNGYVGIANCAAGGFGEQNIVSFGFVSNKNNEYIFNAVIEDVQVHELSPESNYLYVYQITFIKENGNLVISEEKGLDI